jgi:hypothetical protein
LAVSTTLRMETVRTSDTLVNFYKTYTAVTSQGINHCENHKSIVLVFRTEPECVSVLGTERGIPFRAGAPPDWRTRKAYMLAVWNGRAQRSWVTEPVANLCPSPPCYCRSDLAQQFSRSFHPALGSITVLLLAVARTDVCLIIWRIWRQVGFATEDTVRYVLCCLQGTEGRREPWLALSMKESCRFDTRSNDSGVPLLFETSFLVAPATFSCVQRGLRSGGFRSVVRRQWNVLTL